jgi:hypothetical protein
MDNVAGSIFPFLHRSLLRYGNRSQLQIQIKSQANAAQELKVRSLNRDNISEFSHTTNSDGTIATDTFGISDIPVLLTVKDDGGNFTQGDCYVTVSLLVNGEIVYELCSGVVYTQKGLSYPANNSENAIPGRGRFRWVSVSNPSAGQAAFITVPTGRVWKIITVACELQTDSTVATRTPSLAFRDSNDNNIAFAGPATTITADKDYFYFYANYGYDPTDIASDTQLASLPQNIYLPEAYYILLDHVLRKSGDQYANVGALVEEFFAPPA